MVNYSILLFSDDCTEYITEPSGSIRSPGYPNIYPHNKDCTWLISVSSGMYIALMFTHFDVYQGSNPQKCSNDSVEVRDGLSDISHNIGGKYCNGNMAMLILTTGNLARVHFLSGSASPSSHNGFVFEYLSLKPGIFNMQSSNQFFHNWKLKSLLLYYYIIPFMCPLVQHLFCKYVGEFLK